MDAMERTLVTGYGTYRPGEFTVSLKLDRDRWHWVRRVTGNSGAGIWVSRESWTDRIQAETAAFDVGRCYDAIVEIPAN